MIKKKFFKKRMSYKTSFLLGDEVIQIESLTNGNIIEDLLYSYLTTPFENKLLQFLPESNHTIDERNAEVNNKLTSKTL